MHRGELIGPRLRRHMLLRRIVQTGFLAGTNLHLAGWLRGVIYTGQSKAFCIPGLHCYSCPSSVFACPVGSFQNLIAARGFLAGLSSLDPSFTILLGLVGFVLLPGFVAGRICCGWVCPFGLLQDVLFRLSGGSELRIGVPSLSRSRYVFAMIFVLLLPLLLRSPVTGAGEPWFCKVICPAGTALAGWPLVALNPPGSFPVGLLFGWKTLVAVAFLAWAVATRRPFCRFVCPLGAVWGLAGKVSLFRMRVDPGKCIDCGRCAEVCPMGIAINLDPGSTSCIRCGDCVSACPTSAISHSARAGETA